MQSSSTFSFERHRWLLYLLACFVIWMLNATVGPWIAKLSEPFSAQIISATKHRVIDVELLVRNRLTDVAQLATILLAGVALLEGTVRLVRHYWNSEWKFVPISIFSFAIINGMCHLAGNVALVWMLVCYVSPNMRAPNTRMSEMLLQEQPDVRKGMIIGSSQANAQVHVAYLNQLLAGETLFGDGSYSGGHPVNVLMAQAQWSRYPDVVIWYLSVLDILNHNEFGAAAQPLLTGRSEQDVIDFDGESLIGPMSMRYARLGRYLPLFRIRRSMEALTFGVAGTPQVENYELRRTKAETKREGQQAQLLRLLTEGTGDAERFLACQEFQKKCILRVLERFASHQTQVVIIAGHIHPEVESELPHRRKELVGILRKHEENFDNVIVLDDQLPRPLADQYRDLTHLDVTKRDTYTRQLVDVLRERGVL